MTTPRPLAAAALLLAASPAVHAAEPEVRSATGDVAAAHPAGPGWSCADASRTGDGFRLAEVKCRREAPGGAVILYAKDYQGPGEALEAICSRDWREYYKGLAPRVARLDARIVREGSVAWCAVVLDGATADGKPLALREWYRVLPGHVLVVTGSLTGAAARAADGMATAWWKGVRFRAAP